MISVWCVGAASLHPSVNVKKDSLNLYNDLQISLESCGSSWFDTLTSASTLYITTLHTNVDSKWWLQHWNPFCSKVVFFMQNVDRLLILLIGNDINLSINIKHGYLVDRWFFVKFIKALSFANIKQAAWMHWTCKNLSNNITCKLCLMAILMKII